MSNKILVVEDESAIQTVLRTYLEAAGYRVLLTDNGKAAIEIARSQTPDLVILDLMLPGMDGMEVASRLREISDVFILMLTARTEEADRVAGLRLGADDYVTKPFSPREIVARVDTILRRRRGLVSTTQLICFRHLCIDPERYETWTIPDKQPIEFTVTEFRLLLELVRHAGRVLSRDQLIDGVWGINFFGNERVVDVYVGQVRRKLEQATGAMLIDTVRGVGYKFTDERT